MVNASDAVFVRRHRGPSGYHDEVRRERAVLAALHRPRRARPRTRNPGPRVLGHGCRARLRHRGRGRRRRGVRADRRLPRRCGGRAHRHRGTRRRAGAHHDRPRASGVAAPSGAHVVAGAVRSRPSLCRSDRDDPRCRRRRRIDRGATRQGTGPARHRHRPVEGRVPGAGPRSRRVRRRRARWLAGGRRGHGRCLRHDRWRRSRPVRRDREARRRARSRSPHPLPAIATTSARSSSFATRTVPSSSRSHSSSTKAGSSPRSAASIRWPTPARRSLRRRVAASRAGSSSNRDARREWATAR